MTGIGAQQAFSRGGARVSNAPSPAVRRAIAEPLESTHSRPRIASAQMPAYAPFTDISRALHRRGGVAKKAKGDLRFLALVLRRPEWITRNWCGWRAAAS